MVYSSWDGKRSMSAFIRHSGPSLPITIYMYQLTLLFNFHLKLLDPLFQCLICLLLVMQVKNEWLHNAGTGVVAHVADSVKQQESSSYIAASL